MDASLSAGAVKELQDHIGVPTPSAKSQDQPDFAQSKAENTTLPQPHDVEVNESLPTESFLLPDQDASAPPSSMRQGSLAATESPHEDVPKVENYTDEAIDESQNAVHTGQHYPMSLDVDSQDSDSAIGFEPQSSTVSLRSSLFEHIEENGRTYHKYKQGNYYLPNDEVEQSRLDLQHHLFFLTLDGKLALAPISHPNFVLDIGTGTGIWAIEYAIEHPEATVTGVDLSPIQPEFVPPNCQFEIDDVEDDWTYSRQPDYIHGRAMFTCFKDPRIVFQKAYNALAPGGYFEMQDIYFKPHSNDGTAHGTAINRFNELVNEAATKIGRDFRCTSHYAKWFQEVGFEEVVENRFAWPLGTWPKGKKQKTMGMWMLTNALEGAPAIGMALLTRVLGMSLDEVELLLANLAKDIKDRSIHSYFPVYVVYGRKPL